MDENVTNIVMPEGDIEGIEINRYTPTYVPVPQGLIKREMSDHLRKRWFGAWHAVRDHIAPYYGFDGDEDMERHFHHAIYAMSFTDWCTLGDIVDFVLDGEVFEEIIGNMVDVELNKDYKANKKLYSRELLDIGGLHTFPVYVDMLDMTDEDAAKIKGYLYGFTS